MAWMSEKAREMFNKLVNMALRLGRDPTFKEVEQDSNMPHPNDFAYHFGSFTEALKQAHRTAFVYKEQEPEPPVGKIFSNKEEEEMGRRPITDEEYVTGLIRLQKELGHFPTISEARKDNRCPSVTSYERRFGGDWYAVKAAVKRRAKDLGITEANVDDYVSPEKPAGPEAEAIPTPEPTPDIESTENPLADIPTPDFTKYNPDADASEGDVAEAILGPDEDDASEDSGPELVSEPDSIPGLEAEPNPKLEPPAEHAKTELAPLGIFAELSAEPPVLSEVEPEGNKLISLLPQMRVIAPKVEGYATVFVTKGLVPLQKTVVGVPVTKNYCGLNLMLNGHTIPFPEPSENVFYIVERKIASIAKAAGRETYDLLIPEKFDRDEDEMAISEFSIL